MTWLDNKKALRNEVPFLNFYKKLLARLLLKNLILRVDN